MTATVTSDDLRYMDVALALAYARLGATAPNPSVGCVIVKDNRIVGAAATAPGGRPHAETQALDLAGPNAEDATVYVTLEPCSHYGKTPPCAEALVAAKPARVVVACIDPFESVSGRGIARLQEAGIDVVTGVRETAAETLNHGFFTHVKTGRPAVYEDDRAGLYDALLKTEGFESREAALDAAGAAGLTRVYQRKS